MHLVRMVAICGLSVAVSVPLLAASTGALAAGDNPDCACLLSTPPSPPLGSISAANGDVFKTGVSGLERAEAGSPINVDDVVSTGAKSSATLLFGEDCQLALGASAQVTITQAGENLCVRVEQEPVGDVAADGLGLAIAGGLVVGVGLFVGLGLNNPVSQ